MQRLILVRHATTLANKEGRYIGRSESVLSPSGVLEARRLRERLVTFEIQKIYASPSHRVLETIEGIKAQISEVEMVEALREIDFGDYEGKDFNWLKAHAPEEVEVMLQQGDRYRYPKGESLEMHHQRVANWLKILLKTERKGTFLIAAHGGTIRCILSELLIQGPKLHWHFKIDPATLTCININEGFAVIETLNER